jgi:hypothetical protein
MRALLLLLITACATTPPTERGGPRGLRSDQHLDAATRHDDLAAQRSTWPRRSDAAPGSIETGLPVVWYRTWDTAAEHERLAREHRSQAVALQAGFDAACAGTPIEHIRVSPLLRFRTDGWNTANGVVVYLSPLAGTADELLAALRCHRAYMMVVTDPMMDDCPLDLPGLQINARGDATGITLVLGVNDPALVPELQRRVAKQAEQHGALGHDE